MTATHYAKLEGIEAGAEVNAIAQADSSDFKIDAEYRELKVADNKQLMTAAQADKLLHISEYANKVEASSNGNVKIDGADTVVYAHPAGSGADIASGLYKFSTDADSHIASATPVEASDVYGFLAFETPYDASSNKIATVNDIKNFATIDYVDNAISALNDKFNSYAKSADVTAEIATAIEASKILTDATTGKKYILTVINGDLGIQEVD